MSDTANFTQFTSKGTLQQIENSLKAVNNGETSIAIVCKDSVVLVSEKNPKNNLIEYNTIKKNQLVTDFIACNYSGISADYRVLLKKGRKKCKEYSLKYNERVPIFYITRELADVMQEYTQASGVRPFGISLLIATVENGKPILYQIDPSGAYYEWNATSLGKPSSQINVYLEKKWKEGMDTFDGITLALRSLKDEFEGDIKPENFDLTVVRETGVEFIDEEDKLNYLQGVQNI